MNYTDLQTNVADYLHRTDLTTKIPLFIATAESALFRELQIKELQVSTTGTVVSGYVDLPADFLSLSKVSVSSGNSSYVMDYLPEAYVSGYVSTFPQFYALESNKIKIFSAGDGATCTIYYTPKISALSLTNTTNWILDNAYDLYLYASALEGAKYIREDQDAASLQNQVNVLIDNVKRFAEKRGQPTTGSLQIKARA